MSLSISNFRPFCVYFHKHTPEGKSWNMTPQVIGWNQTFVERFPRSLLVSSSWEEKTKDGATFRGWGRGEPPWAGRVRWETGRPWHLHLRDTHGWRLVRFCLKNNWSDSHICSWFEGGKKSCLLNVQFSSITKDHIWCDGVVLSPICVEITLNAPPFVTACIWNLPQLKFPGLWNQAVRWVWSGR